MAPWNAAVLPTENIFNKNTHPYCWDGFQYALDVVAGKIKASVYTIGACKRSLYEIPLNTNAKWVFDKTRAERYLRLVQRFHHVKGHWPIPEIKYNPWQNWVWMNIEGFTNRGTGFRRFRRAHVDIARGNTKSTMASQKVLFDLALDNPNGNLISTAATKKDQARFVLDDARAMADKNRGYLNKTGVKVRAHSIEHPKSNSKVRALSAQAGSLDGLNDVLGVLDELHAMKREVYEVITSGMIKRQDSLTLCITTAGSDTESVGFEENYYAKKLCLGEIEDDALFAVVYTLDEGDNVYDESNWIKANPNLILSPGGSGSVDLEELRAKAAKTLITPSSLPNFKIKNLNIWSDNAEAYFDLSAWDACADASLDISDFKGKKMKGAIDLALRRDLSAKIYIFEENGIYYIFDKLYIPEGTVNSEHGVDKYKEWIDKGWITEIKGQVMDFVGLQEEIITEVPSFKGVEIAYDPWNAAEMAQRLTKKRIEMVEFGQKTSNYSEAMKKLDGLLVDNRIRHRGSPAMRWCMGNVIAKEDANGNVYPRKGHPKSKIDGAMGAIMGIALWARDEQVESIYETRGLRTI